jgi:uncharacterized membrane protein YeaQ/YmgE (transglycosylase-associated protein family)
MDAGLGGCLGTIIIGGLVGWVASMITRTDASMGVVALIGAVIILFAVRSMTGRRSV